MAENAWALHTITSPSLDRHFPLFQHYPAMKLGVRESVLFYADLLAPLAATIVAANPGDWVVTAPPFYVLPAAANLLGWELCRILSLPPADLHYTAPIADFLPNFYSRSGVEDRIKNRRQLHEGDVAPKANEADFRGRHVLFVNDINVTGTQQDFVQRTLEVAHPAKIHWLYIIQVEPAVGRAHPEIEYQLNNLHLDSAAEFAKVMARRDIDFTSRCLSRLMAMPAAERQALLDSLDQSRRNRLHQLILAEGLYHEGHS